jgi:hypothetical protein
LKSLGQRSISNLPRPQFNTSATSGGLNSGGSLSIRPESAQNGFVSAALLAY